MTDESISIDTGTDELLCAIRDRVAVITLNNPPVNGLSHALRTRIVEGVDAAQRDAKAQAIVLIGTEAVWGWRVNVDGSSGNAFRLQARATYDF